MTNQGPKVTRNKTATPSTAQRAGPAAAAPGSSKAKSWYPPSAQVAWKPTLRPPKSTASSTLQQPAAEVESKLTSVMGLGEAEPSSKLDDPTGLDREDGTDADNQVRLPSGLEVDGIDEGACIEALLSWFNDDRGDEVLVYSPMTHASRTALVSAVTEAVNITRCSTVELPGIRTDWGDRACRVEAIAAWSVEDRALSWKFENWRMELQESKHGEENLLICSALVPPDRTWGRQLAAGGDSGNKKYLLVCRFSASHQGIADNKGEYYAISCPPNVLPLRFASVVPTSGQQSRWSLDHRPVLPLAN